MSDLRDVAQICEKLKMNAAYREGGTGTAKATGASMAVAPVKIAGARREYGMVLTQFSVDTFRTVVCPNKDGCDNSDCLYYHNELERRRPSDCKYVSKICQQVLENGKYVDPANCAKGDDCEFCHTKNELYYHRDNYKKKLCQRRGCGYGKFCPDIHPEEAKAEPKKAAESAELKELESELAKCRRKMEKLKAEKQDLKKQLVSSAPHGCIEREGSQREIPRGVEVRQLQRGHLFHLLLHAEMQTQVLRDVQGEADGELLLRQGGERRAVGDQSRKGRKREQRRRR